MARSTLLPLSSDRRYRERPHMGYRQRVQLPHQSARSAKWYAGATGFFSAGCLTIWLNYKMSCDCHYNKFYLVKVVNCQSNQKPMLDKKVFLGLPLIAIYKLMWTRAIATIMLPDTLLRNMLPRCECKCLSSWLELEMWARENVVALPTGLVNIVSKHLTFNS